MCTDEGRERFFEKSNVINVFMSCFYGPLCKQMTFSQDCNE